MVTVTKVTVSKTRAASKAKYEKTAAEGHDIGGCGDPEGKPVECGVTEVVTVGFGGDVAVTPIYPHIAWYVKQMYSLGEG